MRDISQKIGVVQAIAPAVLSATTTSDPIDHRGFESAAIVVNTGAIAGAGDFTAKVQESDTTNVGDFADVAPGDLIGAFPAALVENATAKVGYIGHKRFTRVVLTKNGGTSIAASVFVVKGNAFERPVA